MKHIYGTLLIIWLVIEQTINSKFDVHGIAFLLSVLCLFIVKERFIDNIYSSIVFLIIIFGVTMYKSDFIMLAGISVLDLMYFNSFGTAAAALAAAVCAAFFTGNFSYIFHLISALIFGYVIGIKDSNEHKHLKLLDEERHLRYDLERSQNEIIKSKKEIEQLTEIRERNRIAHEIHDNIGHSIAGVIFQLEAAIRYLRRDIDKSENILNLCSKKLAEALELTRNTVYNIKVTKKTGIDHIEELIQDFNFCSINFKHSGDFIRVSASTMKLLEANIMEALTNASKYSQAAHIEIKVDINRKNIRLYYKDDGIGCKNIKEGLGLSGMRNRVKDAGGIISIDGQCGFLIVCNLPIRNEDYLEGEGI